MTRTEKAAEAPLLVYRALLRFFEKYYWIVFTAACLVLAFFCFRCLDVQYVDSWDEARHGVNAYEMIQNGDYIRHTYNYETDDWNLKPSLSYWAIVLGFRLFGYSVMGLRFISALAYLLTGIACALSAKRYSKEASVLVLGFFCANERPLSAHLARAGDADALYMLFFTLAVLAMLRIRENHRRLYACGLLFSLAFLTKSWHAGMIAAIGGIYLLGTGELFRLKRKEWCGFLAAVFLPLLLWFGWRFTKDGFFFLRQMVEVDLLARTGSTNFEGHAFPFSFYYDMVFGAEGFIYRWLLLICLAGLAAGLVRLWRTGSWKQAWKSGALPDVFGYLLWFLIPFLGFSLIGTKLIWYCYPCTVPLAMGAAVFLGKLLRVPLCREEAQGMADGRSRENRETPAVQKPAARKSAAVKLAAGLGIWILAAGCTAVTGYYMWNTYLHVIREAHGDSFQLFIQESVDRDSEYAGARAYIFVPGEDSEDIGSWDQNMLFIAEISGDFHCMDGGVETFLKEKEPAVLYIDMAHYEEYSRELTKLQVLCENGSYLLLGRKAVSGE